MRISLWKPMAVLLHRLILSDLVVIDSEGSIVTPYEIKLAAVHEAQLTGAEGTLGSAMTFKNKDGDADTMTSNNEISTMK